ncbi:MAG: flagellar assembly protein FliW [Candidatus Fibromonas sp.]|jgi:flagellar assembly factor FliW|nr:flagellar assembly protein FliW [Candidatus Fibromonas sp.]
MEPNRSFIFESGFPGFPGLRRFRLEYDETLAPLEWLVCTEDPDVRFIVVNPMLFRPDYAPRLTKEHMKALNINKKEDLRILVIVTLNKYYEQSTANLASPLMFNVNDYKAVQLLLDDGIYSHTEPIFAEEETC